MRCLLFVPLLVGVVLSHDIPGLASSLSDGFFVLQTCNHMFFYDMVDFDTAEHECEKFFDFANRRRATLATVNDETTNKAMAELLKEAYKNEWKQTITDKWADNKWVWTGLRKTRNLDVGGPKIPYNASEWEWADGSRPTDSDFEKWMTIQPDRKLEKGRGRQYAMRIDQNGWWDDTFMFKKHPFVCDIKSPYVCTNAPKSWSEANAGCADQGLQLAAVKTEKEAATLEETAENILVSPGDSEKKSIWLGDADEADKETHKFMEVSKGGKIEKETPGALTAQRQFCCMCPRQLW